VQATSAWRQLPPLKADDVLASLAGGASLDRCSSGGDAPPEPAVARKHSAVHRDNAGCSGLVVQLNWGRSFRQPWEWSDGWAAGGTGRREGGNSFIEAAIRYRPLLEATDNMTMNEEETSAGRISGSERS
jgi:hypothetical protein